MSLRSVFKESLVVIKEINDTSKINSNKLLEIYGLYKQITCGDVEFNNDFKTLKEKNMWEHYKQFEGLCEIDGMKLFIEIVDDMLYQLNN
jgi:acyl-CoA-binding protein